MRHLNNLIHLSFRRKQFHFYRTSKPRSSVCWTGTRIDFLKLITYPDWVRRKIIVSLFINNSSCTCDMSNMWSGYIITQTWSLLKREIGTLKILVKSTDAGPRLKQRRGNLIVLSEGDKSRRLLGPACTYSLLSGAYFITNSVPPFWNAGMGWNCLDVSNLLLVSCSNPSLIQENGCWDTDFLHGDTGYIALFNNISLSFSLTSLDCSWFKTGRFGDFPCIGFREKESQILEQYLG